MGDLRGLSRAVFGAGMIPLVLSLLAAGNGSGNGYGDGYGKGSGYGDGDGNGAA